MNRRRKRRPWLIGPLLLMAACDVQRVSDPGTYGGGRWWEAPAQIDSTATPSPMPTAIPPAATPSVLATATPTPPATPTVTATATEAPTFVPTEVPTATPTAGFHCAPAVLENEPSEAFDLLAVVEVQAQRDGANRQSPLEAAKLQACALGGDALVILYRNDRGSGTSVITGPSAMLPSPEIRAAVIRYRRE